MQVSSISHRSQFVSLSQIDYSITKPNDILTRKKITLTQLINKINVVSHGRDKIIIIKQTNTPCNQNLQ